MTIILKLLVSSGIFVFTLQAFAYQIEWARHTSNGVEQILLQSKKNSADLLFTNNNYLNFNNPVHIGLFKKKWNSHLYSQLQKISKEKENWSEIKPLPASPHMAEIYFDAKPVPLGSESYKTIENLIKTELHNKAWKPISGEKMHFHKNKSLTLEVWKNQKVLNKKRIARKNICKGPTQETICTTKAGFFYTPIF